MKTITRFDAVFQNNGEGRVKFMGRTRIEHEGQLLEGAEYEAGALRLEDFRPLVFTLPDGRQFTGADWEAMCQAIQLEALRQNEARDAANAAAARRHEAEQASITEQQRHLAEEAAALAKRQADELAAIEAEHAGKFTRGT